MGLSGWVFVALTVIVLGYVLPHLVRSREVKVDSRVTDRFSEGLRLVEVDSPDRSSTHSSSSIHASGKERTEALAMIRPTVPNAARVNARELAASRAACAAEISRRAAAARRRNMVLAVLAVAAIGVGLLGGLSVIHLAWTLIPVALLGGAGYLSVQAERQRRVADARSRSQMHRLDQRLQLFRTDEADVVAEPVQKVPFDDLLTGGAHAPKVLPDEEPRHARETVPVDARSVEERAESRRAVREAASWTPAPVPVPTYTLKQEAPKRAVAAVEAEAAEESRALSPERPTHVVGARHDEEAFEAATSVDSFLERRRAAGM